MLNEENSANYQAEEQRPISVQEFSKKIKEKYPYYKKVDDLTLATKVVEKYPYYKDKVSFESLQTQPEATTQTVEPTTQNPSEQWLKESSINPIIQSIPGLRGIYAGSKQVAGTMGTFVEEEILQPARDLGKISKGESIDTRKYGFSNTMASPEMLAESKRMNIPLSDPYFKPQWDKLEQEQGTALQGYKPEASETSKKIREWQSKVPVTSGAADFVGQLIPQVATMIPVILSRNPNVAKAYLGYMSATSYGSALQSYDDYIKESGEQYNSEDRTATAFGYAAAEYIGDKIGLDHFMPKGYGKVIAKTLHANPMVASKIGKEVLENYARATKQTVKQILKKVAAGSLIEGGEEGITELMQAAADKYFTGRDVSMGEMVNRLIQAVAGGALMGSMVAPFSMVTQKAFDKARRSQQGTVTISINEDGIPIELIKDKNTIVGLTPNGEIINNISEETINKAATFSTDQFESGIADFRKNGDAISKEWENAVIQKNNKDKADLNNAFQEGSIAYKDVATRTQAKKEFEQSIAAFKDIPNANYTEAVDNIVNNFTDPNDIITNFNQISTDLGVNQSDYTNAFNYLKNTVRVNSMNKAKVAEIQKGIDTFRDDNGNITSAEIEGEKYYIKNSADLGQSGRIIFAKNQKGEVKPFNASLVKSWETLTPDQITQTAQQKEAEEDNQFNISQEVSTAASQIGIEPNKSVKTPNGIAKIVSVNNDGTVTVVNQKGLQDEFSIDEVEAYKTEEQKQAEKEALAQQQQNEKIQSQKQKDTAKQETETQQQAIEQQSTETTLEQPSIPKDKDGNPDYDAMDPEVFFNEYAKEFSEEEAKTEIQDMQRAIIEDIKKKTAKKSKATSANERAAIAREIKSLNTRLDNINGVLQKDRSKTDLGSDTKWVAKNSSNPDEIVSAYEQEKSNAPVNNLKEWQKFIIGVKFNPDSFSRFGDKNNVTSTLAKTWLNSDGHDIDQFIRDNFEDVPGFENVTEQDVIDFITENPTGQLRKTTDTQNELRKRYRETTGVSIDNHKFDNETLPTQAKLESFLIENKLNDNWFTTEDLQSLVTENKDKLNENDYNEFTDYLSRELTTKQSELDEWDFDNAEPSIQTETSASEDSDSKELSSTKESEPIEFSQSSLLNEATPEVKSTEGDASIKPIKQLGTAETPTNTGGSTKSGVTNLQESNTNKLESEPNFRVSDKSFITETISELQSKAPNAAPIVVVESLGQIPETVKSHPLFSTQTEGFWYNGKIYIFPNMIKSRDHLISFWIHENGVHNGLRNILSQSELKSLMDLVYDSFYEVSKSNPIFQSIINRVNESYSGLEKDVIAEEFLAYLSEKIVSEEKLTTIEQSAWNKFITRFKDFIGRLFNFNSNLLTEQQIYDIINIAVQSNFQANEPTNSNKERSRGIRQRTSTNINGGKKGIGDTGNIQDKTGNEPDNNIRSERILDRNSEGLTISNKANEDLKSRPNALSAITRIGEELNIPFSIVNSSELQSNNNQLVFTDNGTVTIVSDQIKSVSETIKSIVQEVALTTGIREILAKADPDSIIGKQLPKYDSLTKEELASDKLAQIIRKAFRFTSGQFTQSDLLNIIKEQRSRMADGQKTEENKDGEVRMRIQEMPDKNLIALHNISESQIINADKTGGLITPSLAIVKKGEKFTDFGDITLVGNRELIDPEKSSVKVFKGDVYSPTVPQPEFYRNEKPYKSWVHGIMSKAYDGDYRPIANIIQNVIDDFGSFGKSIKRYNAEIIKKDEYESMKPVYLLEKGIPFKVPMVSVPLYLGNNMKVELSPSQLSEAKSFSKKYNEETRESSLNLTQKTKSEYLDFIRRLIISQMENDYAGTSRDDAWFNKIADGILNNYNLNYFNDRLSGRINNKKELDKKGLKASIDKAFKKISKPDYDNWLNEKINSFQGASYFEKGNQKLPYTVDNLIDATTGHTRAKEKGLTYGMNRAKASAISQLKNIDQIRKAQKDLVSKEEMTAIEKDMQEEYFKVADSIVYKYGDQWGKLDDFGKSLADYFKGNSPLTALSRNNFKPSKSDLDNFKEFADKLKNSPIDYLEAKTQRLVGLDEFSHAVIPATTDKETIAILKKNGIKVAKYTNNDDRADVLNNVIENNPQVRFRLSDKLPETININGVERPTTNSKGQPIADSEEKIRNFYKWFGDSKVVDEEGRPLVVYHGTDYEFTEFDKNMVRHTGFFFSIKNSVWSDWGKNEMPVYLNIRNAATPSNSYENSQAYRELSQKAIDGIMFGDMFVVTEPTQIKSATDNIGTFDGSNPDIRFRMIAQNPDFKKEHERYNGKDFEIKGDNLYTTVYNTRFDTENSGEFLGADINVNRAIDYAESNPYDYDYTGASVSISAEHLKIPVKEIIDNTGDDEFKPEDITKYEIDDFLKGKDTYKYTIGDDYYTYAESEADNANTDDLIYDVKKELSNRFNTKIDKYSTVYVDKHGNITGESYDENDNENREVSIRIADHTHNPRNGRPDVTIVIANKNATAGKFAGASTDLSFDEDYSSDEIADEIEQYIKDNYSVDNIRFRIDKASEEVNTNPTNAQKEAGNYKKGHIKFDGFDISIENPKGSTRSGVDEYGESWETVLPVDYGYFRGTVGKDKDHIDVFIGSKPEIDKVYVVDQINPKTGNFDEHKVMLGFNGVTEARKAYQSSYPKGWEGLKNITRTTKEGLKDWFENGNTKKPFADSDIRFRLAYHGSPHQFDKFTTEKIGTGEGNQAFGWGLYFTDKKSIAEDYANKLQPNRMLIDGKTFDQIQKEIGRTPAMSWVEIWHNDGMTKSQIINKLNEELKDKERLASFPWIEPSVKKTLDYLKNKEITKDANNRSVYEVELHQGKEPGEYDYLRWDKPVGEKQQTKFFNKAREEKLPLSAKDWAGKSDIFKDGKSLYDYLTFIYRSQGINKLVEDGIIGQERFSMNDNQIYDKAASLFLLRAGIDGIQYPTEVTSKGSHEESFNYVIFDENAVEVKEHVRFRQADKPIQSEIGFYSPTEKALNAIQQEKGTAGQFEAMLIKNGAKQAELDWMGWKQQFPSVNQKVTKEDVQNWIDQNKIEVEEVVKGSDFTGFTPDEQKRFNYYSNEYISGHTLTDEEDADYTELSERVDNSTDDTKFSRWVEPGGINYKELLLTMPFQNNRPTFEEWKEHLEFIGYPQNEITIEKYNKDTNWKNERGLYAKDQIFKSSHFDEPNILAHVRFNEREVNGERVLFIEEWQADKGQEWQKLKKLIDSGKATQADIDRFNFLDKNFPFNKTSEWLQLAMRRMMRYAAENGFDRIAWTNGEQQAARYDLSKQVQTVRFDKILGKYDLKIQDLNGNGQNIGLYGENELPDVVGKELANKIIEDSKKVEYKTYSGLDLKVGGSGMKAFYDAIVPSAASKLGKPFGAKVENIQIDVKPDITDEGIDLESGEVGTAPEGKYATVQSLPVTDKMIESVSQGVPLFRQSDITKDLSSIEQLSDIAFKVSQKSANTVPKNQNEDTEKAMNKAHGLKGETILSKIDRWKQEIKETTQHFKYVTEKEFPQIYNDLRLFESIPEVVKKDAYDKIANIVRPIANDKNLYKAFERYVVISDLMHDIKSGIYTNTVSIKEAAELKGVSEKEIKDLIESGEIKTMPHEKGQRYQLYYDSVLPGAPKSDIYKQLPFSMKSVDEVEAYYNELREYINNNPSLRKVIANRNSIIYKVRDQLIENGLMSEKARDNTSYFHHMVMKYRENPEKSTAINQNYDVRVHPRGWQKSRTGSMEDYNTDYLQSEFEVIAQSLEQLAVKKSLQKIGQEVDIMPSLVAQANNEGGSWRDFIPEGYTTWHPKPGTNAWAAASMAEKAIQSVIEGNPLTESLNEQLAEADQTLWVIPTAIANQLDEMKTPTKEMLPVRGMRFFNSTWKQWVLLNPARLSKYMINNFSGDLDIVFAYNPKILLPKYTWTAAKELYNEATGKGMSKDMREAIENAVISSGLSIQEIPDVNKEGVFKTLIGDNNLFKKYWNTATSLNDFREGMLRLAAYKFFKEELNAGKTHHGVSNPKAVDSLRSNEEKAGKMARELLGDYGNLSQGGVWLRSHAYPFWSWTEINAPRYYKLLRNTYQDTNSVSKTAGAAIRKTAISSTALAARIMLLSALVTAWNRLFFPDEDDELTKTGNRQLRLITGRRDDGSIVTLRIQGAFSDVLSFVGLEDAYQDVRDIKRGKTTVEKKAKEAGSAFINRVGQGAMPFERLTGELITGKSVYPDILHPRPIIDRAEHAFRMVSLDKVYRFMTKKPLKKGGKELIGLVLYETDPGEAAYYAMRQRIYDFLDEKEYERPSGDPTEKSIALRYYKQAKKFKDTKLENHWLAKYKALGGTTQGMKTSIKKGEVTNALPREYKKEFLDKLDGEDREVLEMAERWYDETYKK